MQIVQKKVDELIPYEKNPRKNEKAIEKVANSIREFGFKVPIVIDKNGVIVAGHTRYKASQELGLDEVPCIVADDLTPKQIKAFRIAENKTNDLSTWDEDLLGEELNDILDDFDMTDFGFGEFELSILTDDFVPEPYDNDLIEQYKDIGENELPAKRVIITYATPEGEAFVKRILQTDELKVVYSAEDLLGERE